VAADREVVRRGLQEGADVEDLSKGVAGLLVGTAILGLHAYLINYTDWRLDRVSRWPGLLFGIVCVVAGVVYTVRALLGSTRSRSGPGGTGRA
jgi:hypothetical protein